MIGRMTNRNDVPCGACQACCRDERVVLSSDHGDDALMYWTEEKMIGGVPRAVLAHKPNGECVYLTEVGCIIHDKAPFACRQFDCRKWYTNTVDQELEIAELLRPDDLEGFVERAAKVRLEK